MKKFLGKKNWVLATFVLCFLNLQAQEGGHEKGKHYVGPGVAGYLNGGGIFGQYDYGVHKNWSIGTVIGFSFAQKNNLNRAPNFVIVNGDINRIDYIDRNGDVQSINANSGATIVVFMSIRADYHFGKLMKLPKNWDVYAGIQGGPSFYLNTNLDYVNANNYLNSTGKDRFNNLNTNSTLIGKHQVDGHAGVHMGMRYFFENQKIGLETEAFAGYNLIGIAMAAIWKLGK